MSKSKLKIVFLGTPEFAVASLQALHQSGHEIVGVVTAPDKPAGRGLKLQETAVKKYALEQGLYLMQPEKLKNPGFLEELKSLNADVQAVVAFRMLPEQVWNMPRLGTVNVHASLLPQYRGAAPINWVLINGEKETGVTTFKLRHDIDTGPLLYSQRVAIGEDETAGELHDKLKLVGATLLVKTMDELATGSAVETPQPSEAELTIKHAPKIFTENCRIDFNTSVNDAYNLVRGLSPYPTAFTQLGDRNFRIYSSKKEPAAISAMPGSYELGGKSVLKFACTDGWLHALEVQIEGKKRMSVTDFLRGWRPVK